jgi:hypothetical protein
MPAVKVKIVKICADKQKEGCRAKASKAISGPSFDDLPPRGRRRARSRADQAKGGGSGEAQDKPFPASKRAPRKARPSGATRLNRNRRGKDAP